MMALWWSCKPHCTSLYDSPPRTLCAPRACWWPYCLEGRSFIIPVSSSLTIGHYEGGGFRARTGLRPHTRVSSRESLRIPRRAIGGWCASTPPSRNLWKRERGRRLHRLVGWLRGRLGQRRRDRLHGSRWTRLGN